MFNHFSNFNYPYAYYQLDSNKKSPTNSAQGTGSKTTGCLSNSGAKVQNYGVNQKHFESFDKTFSEIGQKDEEKKLDESGKK